jgi:hypothetical protein
MLLVRSRWLSRPLGALVFRRHPDHLHWLDWIGPAESTSILLAVARHLAAAGGLPRVDAWITRSQVHRLVAQNDHEATVADLQIPLPTIVHTPGPALDSLRDRWFLTAGDADFV